MKCPNTHNLSTKDKLLRAIFGEDAEYPEMLLTVVVEAPGLVIRECPICKYKQTTTN